MENIVLIVYIIFICICPIYSIVLGRSNLKKNSFSLFSKSKKIITNIIIIIFMMLGIIGIGIVPMYGFMSLFKGVDSATGPSKLDSVLFYMSTIVSVTIQIIISILINRNIKKYQENPEGGKTKCQE